MVTISDYEKLVLADISHSPKEQTIADIIRQWKNGRLQIPEIQRGFVWNREKAESFIISLIQNYPIPPIFKIKIGDNYYVIDGQQRLKTILWFMGELKEDSDVYAKLKNPYISYRKFSESLTEIGLDADEAFIKEVFSKRNIEKLRRFLEDRSIPVVEINVHSDDSSISEKLMIDIFVRMNKGSLHLGRFDILRAMYYNVAKEYFDSLIRLSNKVMEVSGLKARVEDIAEKIMVLDYLLNGVKLTTTRISKSSRPNDIIIRTAKDRARFFKANPNTARKDIMDFEERINRDIEAVSRIFGDYSFVQPAIHKDYAMLTTPKRQRKLSPTIFVFQVISVDTAFKLDKELLYYRSDEFKHEVMFAFYKAMKESNSSIYRGSYVVEEVYQFLKRKAIEVVENLAKKPSQTYNQRSPQELKKFLWDIYTDKYKREPKCPICGNVIKHYDVCELGHIEPYSSTENSSILNLVLVHSQCNKYLGNTPIKIDKR